jgi:hypothetical protein
MLGLDSERIGDLIYPKPHQWLKRQDLQEKLVVEPQITLHLRHDISEPYLRCFGFAGFVNLRGSHLQFEWLE